MVLPVANWFHSCRRTSRAGGERSKEAAPLFLATDRLLSGFAETLEEADASYRRFVADGRAPSPWLELKNHVNLGSEQLVERTQGLIDPRRPLQEIPKPQRRPVAKPLEH